MLYIIYLYFVIYYFIDVLRIDVIVHNQTPIKLELMKPLMPLAKTKNLIFQFQTSVQWLFFQLNSTRILLFEIKSMLQNMALEISQLFLNDGKSLKISILPFFIYGDQFNSIYIQSDISYHMFVLQFQFR